MTQQPSTTLLNSLTGSTNKTPVLTESRRAGLESDSNTLKFKDIVESVKAGKTSFENHGTLHSGQSADAEQLQSVLRSLASLLEKSGKFLPGGELGVDEGSPLSTSDNFPVTEEQLDSLIQQINGILEQADISPQQLVSQLGVFSDAELGAMPSSDQSLLAALLGHVKSEHAASTAKPSFQSTGMEPGGLTIKRLNQLAHILNQAAHGLRQTSDPATQLADDGSKIVAEMGQAQGADKGSQPLISMIGQASKSELKSNGVANIGSDFEFEALTTGGRRVKGDWSLGQFDKWLQGQLNGGNAKASASLLTQSSPSGFVESFAKAGGQAGLELSQVAASPTAIAASIAETTAGTTESARAVATAPLVMYGKQWQGDLSQKINWMMKAGLEQAEIQLDPKELGPINIRVIQGNGEVQVVVQAQHGQTRELFESNQERLREMLEQQGINLSQFDVQSQSRDDKADSEHADVSSNSLDSEVDEETSVNEVHLANTQVGQRALLDLFV